MFMLADVALAQVPQAFHYQAVARDAQGDGNIGTVNAGLVGFGTGSPQLQHRGTGSGLREYGTTGERSGSGYGRCHLPGK